MDAKHFLDNNLFLNILSEIRCASNRVVLPQYKKSHFVTFYIDNMFLLVYYIFCNNLAGRLVINDVYI